MRGHTVDTESGAQDQIRAFVERIMRMREEARAINDDIREIYAEAKGNGFDKTVLGKIVLYIERDAKDHAGRMEGEALFELYLGAFYGPAGTPIATHTHEIEYPRGESGTAREASGGKRTAQAEMRGLQDGTESAPPSNSEPAPAADPTGKGLNPLSPSEEAPLPVTESTAARKDVPHEAGNGVGESLNEPAQALRDAEAGTQAPPVDPLGVEAARGSVPHPVTGAPTWPKRVDRDHCLNPSACGAMGSRNHCHGCETAHLRKLESIDA